LVLGLTAKWTTRYIPEARLAVGAIPQTQSGFPSGLPATPGIAAPTSAAILFCLFIPLQKTP